MCYRTTTHTDTLLCASALADWLQQMWDKVIGNNHTHAKHTLTVLNQHACFLWWHQIQTEEMCHLSWKLTSRYPEKNSSCSLSPGSWCLFIISNFSDPSSAFLHSTLFLQTWTTAVPLGPSSYEGTMIGHKQCCVTLQWPSLEACQICCEKSSRGNKLTCTQSLSSLTLTCMCAFNRTSHRST